MNAILALNAARDASAGLTYARLAAISRETRSSVEQAAALGTTLSALPFLRRRARAAGFIVVPPLKPVATFTVSSKLAAIEAGMRGPGCPRDGLRGPHVCTTESRDELATSRPGSSYAPPTLADGDEDLAPAPRRESLNNACIRHRLERQTLIKLLEAAGVERPGRAKTKWFLDPGEVDRVVGAWRAAP